MTPPMTPREKVVFKQPCEHCQRMTTVDLTALASGSGDHADHSGEATDMVDHDGLEVLAWAFKLASDDTWDVCLTDPRCDTSDFSAVEPLVTAASAEALLAENAALRERLETARIARAAHNRQHDEAERKLAEAEQVIREISETAQTTRVRHLARTFLSKEVERG